ncbi:hypothetical protein FB451DRAFT_1385170 [Mycena latifolia]|nr:hypothetical protein FB451DRAFT_1385170 [Mycena latifolia]
MPSCPRGSPASQARHDETVRGRARLATVSKSDPLTANWDGKLPSTDIDCLANDGAALAKAIEADPVTKQRLYDVRELFKGGEMSSKEIIENDTMSRGRHGLGRSKLGLVGNRMRDPAFPFRHDAQHIAFCVLVVLILGVVLVLFLILLICHLSTFYFLVPNTEPVWLA